MSLLERVFFFHQEIQKGRYPNSRAISEHFEVSVPTAKRDIMYLRDRLLAPLVFDPQKNGYHYETDDFHLPFEETPRLVFLLAILGKLAGEAGIGNLKEIKQLEKRLSTMITGDYQKVLKNLQVQWIEIESISKVIFEKIIEALATGRFLKLDYRSIGGKQDERSVAPLQVINYQGRWYLYAFCTLRQEERLFHLGRIQSARVMKKTYPKNITFDQNKLNRSFGIFQGEPRYQAEILFTSTAAELVQNQRWHKDQAVKMTDDGVILTLPVSDDREIVMKILQYGSMAQVLSPPELVNRVSKEISLMAANY